jgi:hypothetical protein
MVPGELRPGGPPCCRRSESEFMPDDLEQNNKKTDKHRNLEDQELETPET